MSADGWATCPVDDGRFREDWAIGLNDPESWGEDEAGKDPCIIVNYTGECQACGFKVEFEDRRPVEVPRLVNKPIGPIERRPWTHIPALWFVHAPNGAWYEVLGTVRAGDLQNVTLQGIGTHERVRAQEVPCRAGTMSVPWETMRDGLEAEILEDGS